MSLYKEVGSGGGGGEEWGARERGRVSGEWLFDFLLLGKV
jgi:hypothetical protein